MRLAKGAGSWIIFTGFLIGIMIIFSFMLNGRLQLVSQWVFLFLLMLEGFFLIFFRDPHRIIAEGIVAAADGTIREVTPMYDDDVGESIYISTFMNVYHVHVNRIPFSGTIQSVTHIPGSHIPAFKKESLKNERVITLIKTDIGLIKIIQIAGSIARRIESYISPNQQLQKGERMGIIKMGSRVDLIIPKKAIGEMKVKKGDHVRAGESTICNIQLLD